MAAPASPVERRPVLAHEAIAVAAGVQGQLEHSEGEAAVEELAAPVTPPRRRGAVRPARPDHELANTAAPPAAAPVHQPEALVAVRMGDQRKLGAAPVELLVHVAQLGRRPGVGEL